MPSPFIRSKRHRRPNDADQDSWLITYADLITQLMCFFLLLIMVSEPQLGKFEDATKAFASGFMPEVIETPYTDFYKNAEHWVEAEGIAVNAAVEYSNRGVSMDLAGDALFGVGSATPTPETMTRMQNLAPALKELPWKRAHIIVEGHSDDTPTTGTSYASAWELSAARAGAIARLLAMANVPPERIQIRAFGAMKPLVPNRDANDKAIPDNQARNRRVIIRIERAD